MVTGATEIARFLAGPGATALTEFLSRQRWFAAKARGIHDLGVEDWATLRPFPPLLLFLVNVDGDRYYVPLSATTSLPEGAPGRITRFGEHVLRDAHWDPEFGRLLLSTIASGGTLLGASGRFVFRPMEPWSGPPAPALAAMPVRPLEGEQSNTSLLFDRALILKSFRRPQTGMNPDLEITHFLTSRTGFPHATRLAGWVEYADREGHTATVAVLQFFVENEGDGWEYTLAGLRRLCETVEREGKPPPMTPRGFAGDLLDQMRTLGVVTGGLHTALGSDASLPDFRPEPITVADTSCWGEDIARDAEGLCVDLARARSRVPVAAQPALAVVDRTASRIELLVRDLGVLADGQICKIRCHGDYHLGQVLKTRDAFLVIDFEGEPARPLPERRRKHAALRDVAGMLRSFDYAVHTIARERVAEGRPSFAAWLEHWEALARRAFLDGYIREVSRSLIHLVPADPAELAQACAVFELEKACYELRYELNNRPDWIAIPLAGISRILQTTSPRD